MSLKKVSDKIDATTDVLMGGPTALPLFDAVEVPPHQVVAVPKKKIWTHDGYGYYIRELEVLAETKERYHLESELTPTKKKEDCFNTKQEAEVDLIKKHVRILDQSLNSVKELLKFDSGKAAK